MSLRLAQKVAGESQFKRARVGAVVVKSGRVLATGCNRIGYTKYITDRHYPESVHAEQQAILELLKQRRLDDLVGATLYVARIGRRGDSRLARPCGMCSRLIEAVGIRKVVYTT